MEKLILLIDDDKEEYQILSSVLEIMDKAYKCTWANDAEQAFAFLEQSLPHYIFVDLNMPKTDGLTCIKAIRAIKKLQEVPVILYSNSIDEQVRTEALQLGTNYILRKNGSLAELLQRLEALFAANDVMSLRS